MANWNSGIIWNDGTLWGPTPTPPGSQTNPNRKKKRNRMKRQHYFPRAKSAHPEWYGNYAELLPTVNATLGLDAAAVTATIGDARFLEYATGSWITAVREFGPAATSSIIDLESGTGAAAHSLPGFGVPTLPTGVVAVLPGARDRVFRFVQTIKNAETYTEAIGLQLGIVGAEDTIVNLLPTFTAQVERGDVCECVRIAFKKFGHNGVVIHSKRGAGDWQLLAIDLSSPYLDERPLLVDGQPEMREYRLQFYEDAAASGDFTDVTSVTVGP